MIDIVTERFYPAEVAGLSYYIHAQGISALGFSDKLPDLVERLTRCLSKDHPDFFLLRPECEERFGVLLERKIRRRKNFAKKRPMSIASSLLGWMLYEDEASHGELLAELTTCSWDSFVHFCNETALQQDGIIIDQLAVGNLEREQVMEMHAHARRAVSTWRKGGEKATPHRRIERIIRIPRGVPVVLETGAWNPKEKNGACIVEWQIGEAGDIAMAARTMLLVAIMKQKAFAELRTKQQLGYVVQTSTRNHLGVTGLRMLIQSKAMPPDEVGKRIDDFLRTFRSEFLGDSKTSVDVETYKASLRQKLKEPDKSVYETFSRLRSAFLAPRSLMWERRSMIADEIDRISTNDLAAIFDAYIARGGGE